MTVAGRLDQPISNIELKEKNYQLTLSVLIF